MPPGSNRGVARGVHDNGPLDQGPYVVMRACHDGVDLRAGEVCPDQQLEDQGTAPMLPHEPLKVHERFSSLQGMFTLCKEEHYKGQHRLFRVETIGHVSVED